jgi:3-oxoacyl-[acyl-carrier protein] reductase
MTTSGQASKVFAVTGGSSGIGAATVELLASRGHQVVVLDLSAPGLDASREQGVDFLETDVSDAASVKSAFDWIAGQHDRLDGLVNSAGVESRALLEAMTEEAWDRVLGINLKGTMSCTREAAALMRPRRCGAVVNVASVAGKRISYSGDVAYTASKGAVLAFTRHAAFELAADNIRVTAVCPGPTLTPMIRRSLTQPMIDAIASSVPLGRWVQASDVAHAIEFLLGDGAAMCTGTSLDIDGGVLVSNGSRYEDYFAARTHSQ